MGIRVIAGTARGKQLKMVPGDSTRPIMDRVKESLFNIIGADIIDATFLDLFAGTGSVGIEALSRGAERAIMLDLDKKAVQTIQDNVKLARVQERAVVLRADAFGYLEKPPRIPFDYIFIAPPQYQGLWKRVLRFLDDWPAWIGEDTIVIVQVDPSEREPLELRHLVLDDERRYGNTELLFFVRADESGESSEPSGA
ncbi:MAG: 16S rRNA (guanine(966)-N(2))-methyltransferase RsmD [Anaerolineae bacterium]